MIIYSQLAPRDAI